MTVTDWQVLGLTLQVALLATASILVPGIVVAWALARTHSSRGSDWPGRALLESLVSLPLVLPPTAIGLALLLLLGRNGPLGAWLQGRLGWEIPFTRAAAVLAAAVMSFPLLVRSTRSALEEVDPRLLGVARTLGRGPLSTFLTVHLPLAWRGLLAGAVLAFTRALGEFGATVVVAGNIPGRTRTLALALFQHIQMGRDGAALRLAALSAVLAFVALFAAERLARRRERALDR